MALSIQFHASAALFPGQEFLICIEFREWMGFWYGMDILENRKCPVHAGNRKKFFLRSDPQP
jgi:hypothetical protein